jgi:hypothetical protein
MTETRQQRLARDPLGSGRMCAVGILKVPPPAGWSLCSTPSGEPVYLGDDRRSVVQVVDTRDAGGRRWRHVYVFLARAPSAAGGAEARALAEPFIALDLPGASGAEVFADPPVMDPRGRHVLVRVHARLGSARAPLGRRAQPVPAGTLRARADRSPTHLRLVSPPA